MKLRKTIAPLVAFIFFASTLLVVRAQQPAYLNPGYGPASAGCAGVITGQTKVGLINTTANVQLITGVANTRVFICAITLITASADNIALVEGTGSTCGTNTLGMSGGNTAALGWNLAANSGVAQGNGQGILFQNAVAANNVCLFVSGATQVSGSYVYTVY